MDIKRKGLGLYEPGELKNLDKSLMMQAIVKEYNGKNEKPKKEKNEQANEEVPYWKERLTCQICGKTYFRSAGTKHRRTNHHKIYEKMNEKIRKFVLE